MILDAVWIKMNFSAWINGSRVLFLLLLQAVSHSQLFSFIKIQTLVCRWALEKWRWGLQIKIQQQEIQSGLAIFLTPLPFPQHLTKNTHTDRLWCFYTPKKLAFLIAGTVWSFLAWCLAFKARPNFPFLEKPVGKNGPISVSQLASFLAPNDSRGWLKVQATCLFKLKTVTLVLDHGSDANKNR